MCQMLATTRRVVVFDWIGHGETDPCGSYSLDNFVQQLEEVVAAVIENNRPFILYGFSMGCFISAHYTQRHPERVEKLVLHSPWNAELSVFGPGLHTAVQVSRPPTELHHNSTSRHHHR